MLTKINKYFFIILFGLLTVMIIELVAPNNEKMIVEQIGNGFKIACSLIALFMWGTVYNKFSNLVIISFAFFNGIVPILATWHAFTVIMLNGGGDYLFNSIFHYAVIILFFGQYYLTKAARDKCD